MYQLIEAYWRVYASMTRIMIGLGNSLALIFWQINNA